MFTYSFPDIVSIYFYVKGSVMSAIDDYHVYIYLVSHLYSYNVIVHVPKTMLCISFDKLSKILKK